jgi:hypothetical protein
MGRLEHLKTTLPRVVGEFGRAVLVDWSCPERCGEWANAELRGRVSVVNVPNQAYYQRARALNVGAKRAIELGASFLFFLDADSVIEPGLFAACTSDASPGFMLMVDPADEERLPGLSGILMVASTDFSLVGGYDEAFTGYGSEDMELRFRLAIFAGVRVLSLPPNLLGSIPHDDDSRTRHHELKTLLVAKRRNLGMLLERIERWVGIERGVSGEFAEVVRGHLPPDEVLDALRELRGEVSPGSADMEPRPNQPLPASAVTSVEQPPKPTSAPTTSSRARRRWAVGLPRSPRRRP